MKWVEWVSYELEQKADIDEVKLMQQLIQAEFLQTFINLYAHSTLNVSTVNCLRSTGLLFLLFFDNSIIIIMSSEWHESSRSKTLRAREPKHHKNLWKCEKRWVEFVRSFNGTQNLELWEQEQQIARIWALNIPFVLPPLRPPRHQHNFDARCPAVTVKR